MEKALEKLNRYEPGQSEGYEKRSENAQDTACRYLKVTSAADIAMKAIRWIWEDDRDHWIPMGEITGLAGREGVGKSTWSARMAAKVTKGELPGDFYGKPKGVVIVTTEDDQLGWGTAPYFKSRLWMDPQINGGLIVRVETEGFQHAPPGPWVMLMAPAEGDTSSRLRSVVALLRLALGRNIAVEPLGDLMYTASIPNATATERPLRPPVWDPPPDLAPERLGLVSELDAALDALDEEPRNRVELSLQWYFRASSEIQGLDGFLMYWFALDVLAMPRSSGRFVALERRLSEIYELDLRGSGPNFDLESCSVYATTLSMKDINRRSTAAPSTIWAQSIGTCCWTRFDSLHGRLPARFSRPTTSTTGSPSLDRENLGRPMGAKAHPETSNPASLASRRVDGLCLILE